MKRKEKRVCVDCGRPLTKTGTDRCFFCGWSKVIRELADDGTGPPPPPPTETKKEGEKK